MARSGAVRPRLITTSNDGIEYQDTFWNDLRVPLSATRKPSASLVPPDTELFRDNGSGSGGVWCDAFDNSVEESVLFEVQVPHEYKQGTSLRLHVHWAKSDSAAGNVSWGAEHTFAEIGDVFPNTTINTANTITVGDGDDHEHCLTELV